MKKKVIILIALCCLFIQAAQSDTLFHNRPSHGTTD